jgi:hypothetical protein
MRFAVRQKAFDHEKSTMPSGLPRTPEAGKSHHQRENRTTGAHQLLAPQAIMGNIAEILRPQTGRTPTSPSSVLRRNYARRSI